MPGRIRKYGITVLLLLGLAATPMAETVVQDMSYYPIVTFTDTGEFVLGGSELVLGNVGDDGKVYRHGVFVGVDKGGTLIDPDYNIVGYYKDEGHVLDADYNVIGYLYEGGRLVNADMLNVGYVDGERNMRMLAIYVLFFEGIFYP
ncbi:MAG: hypothetical protein GY771_11205 [bacterium]|nr:hypothetical protein [bacterium]